jgi:transcriptional regulator with XRE-family HTH domain
MIGPVTSSPSARTRPARPLLRTTVGEVLRRTRLAQHRTLADVARSARVSVPYLSELERGRKEASSEVLAAICEALRVDLPDLLAEVRRALVHSRGRRPAVLRLSPVLRPQAPAADFGDTAGQEEEPAGPSASPDAADLLADAGGQDPAGQAGAASPEDRLATPGAVLQFPGDVAHGSQAPLDGPAGPDELGLRRQAELPGDGPDELRLSDTARCQLAA